jgi:hypothetical protein
VWAANGVGRGCANTDAMLSACISGAARAADNYTTGSTQAGDWFLPSIGELMLMYTNLRQAGVGDFPNDIYGVLRRPVAPSHGSSSSIKVTRASTLRARDTVCVPFGLFNYSVV